MTALANEKSSMYLVLVKDGARSARQCWPPRLELRLYSPERASDEPQYTVRRRCVPGPEIYEA